MISDGSELFQRLFNDVSKVNFTNMSSIPSTNFFSVFWAWSYEQKYPKNLSKFLSDF
jgi:hypothetical protein